MHDALTKPRLLVLASTYPRWPGDPEPGFVHELSRRMAGEYDVMVLCPHAAGAQRRGHMDEVIVRRFRYAPSSLESLVNDGGIVANLRRKRWRYLLLPAFFAAGLFALWRAQREWRPDAIHAHWLIPQGLSLWLLGRIRLLEVPWLCTSHGADLFALRSSGWLALKRRIVRAAGALTVVSEGMLPVIAELVPGRHDVKVAAMGVDLSQRFVPDPAVRRVPDELLFVGRLVEKKGLHHLLDALPAIIAARPATRLRIAGFGPEQGNLHRQAERLGLAGHVEFVGAVSQHELPPLYRRASLFVAPFIEAASGDQEGLGLVTVEAMGCGCPVLIGDLPATRALPVDRVDARAPAELTKAVIAMLSRSDEQIRLCSAAARCHALEHFDWPVAAAAYLEILRSLRSNATD